MPGESRLSRAERINRDFAERARIEQERFDAVIARHPVDDADDATAVAYRLRAAVFVAACSLAACASAGYGALTAHGLARTALVAVVLAATIGSAAWWLSVAWTLRGQGKALSEAQAALHGFSWLAGVVALVVGFAAVTSLLAQHGTVRTTTLSEDELFRGTSAYYAWHLLDLVPALDIPATVNWSKPTPVSGMAVGWMLLAFKLLVLAAVIPASVRLVDRATTPPNPEAILSSRSRSWFAWERVLVSWEDFATWQERFRTSRALAPRSGTNTSSARIFTSCEELGGWRSAGHWRSQPPPRRYWPCGMRRCGLKH